MRSISVELTEYWPRNLPTFLCRCCLSCLLEILILNCDLTELKWSDNRPKKKDDWGYGYLFFFFILLNLAPVPRLSQVIILDNQPKKLESETLKIWRNARIQCPYTEYQAREQDIIMWYGDMMTAVWPQRRIHVCLLRTPYFDRDSWTGLNIERTRSKTFDELECKINNVNKH